MGPLSPHYFAVAPLSPYLRSITSERQLEPPLFDLNYLDFSRPFVSTIIIMGGSKFAVRLYGVTLVQGGNSPTVNEVQEAVKDSAGSLPAKVGMV